MGFRPVPEQSKSRSTSVSDPRLTVLPISLQLSDPHARKFTTMELRTAMLDTVATVNRLTKEVAAETGHHFDPHLMNFVVSDGENVVATR